MKENERIQNRIDELIAELSECREDERRGIPKTRFFRLYHWPVLFWVFCLALLILILIAAVNLLLFSVI